MREFIVGLDRLDPWALVAAGFFLLWLVEMRFGARMKYRAGLARGYDMAARHLKSAYEADEAVTS